VQIDTSEVLVKLFAMSPVLEILHIAVEMLQLCEHNLEFCIIKKFSLISTEG